MFDAIVLWLHVVGAVVFIGPQVFLAAVAMPALRSVSDAQSRQQATRAITRGFGVLGGGALLLLLATGIYNFYDRERFFDADVYPRYFFVLQVKLTLVTVVIVLTALHAMVLGRRLQGLQESGAPEAEIAAARRWSMVASIGTLAVSIAILLCAALLASDWSKL
jgi:uncharacterized membrane protein